MYARAGITFVIFVGGGVMLAVNHVWILAAVLIVMGVFGLWLATLYGRSDRWGR